MRVRRCESQHWALEVDLVTRRGGSIWHGRCCWCCSIRGSIDFDFGMWERRREGKIKRELITLFITFDASIRHRIIIVVWVMSFLPVQIFFFFFIDMLNWRRFDAKYLSGLRVESTRDDDCRIVSREQFCSRLYIERFTCKLHCTRHRLTRDYCIPTWCVIYCCYKLQFFSSSSFFFL